MAWIGGQQKPFYNPRKIKQGRAKGQIEVEYLYRAGIYRKIKIDAAEIIELEAASQGLARQMSFEDFINEKK